MTNSTDFFEATEQLKKIRQWARARFAAPDAVFGAVLLRVAASTPPEVQLPGLIGGRASLNLLAAFVSPSGGGKGISDKVSRLAWPTTIVERPIGSGEGIAALFVPPKKEGVERIDRAIISVSEIDTLAGIASRQGSILLAQLKAMAMGELLGQSNASETTSRVVQPHTYRCCLSVGAQPGHTGVIFNDTTGGTPQRFLWFPTIDPDMPATAASDPDPLNTTTPWPDGTDSVVEIGYGPEEITRTVIEAHIARQRGDADALDGHRMLTRCKVAAVLAIMHQRAEVTELDWQLSEHVMTVSDRTREWIVNEAQKAARAKVRARALDRAAGEEFYDSSRLETVKRSILRMLERDGEQAGGDLRRRLGKRDKRELFDQAIALLEADGLVSSRAGTYNGMSYTYWSPLTSEVTPESRRSEPVTPLVTPDHPATVTDLDSRRSNDLLLVKPSARVWLDHHVATLRSEGHETVRAFAVYQAGKAAGYTRSNLAQAASTNPDIVVIDKTGGASTWSITGEHQVYVTAAEWAHKYLDRLPADTTEIDQTAFRHAAVAAGYTWPAVRNAALRSGRIDSIPAHGNARAERIWLMTEPTTTEGEQPA